MRKTITILEPSYMEQFRCTGSRCEDTCCHGWKVNIDKRTYKKYTKLNDAKYSSIIKQQVKRIKKDPDDVNYAYIKMDESGSCPFLTDSKLCGLQLNHGEKYLSSVCAQYPRVLNFVNNTWERSGLVSCPEAARLMLLNPYPMEFNLKEEYEDLENKYIHSTPLFKHSLFWDLRVFTIGTLQNRDYTIQERLIILGMFCMEADALDQNSSFEDIYQLMANYEKAISEGELKAVLTEVPKAIQIQLEILKLIADLFINKGSKRFAECFLAFLKGIKYIKGMDLAETSRTYECAHDDYYYPFMKDREYIYENYLVNYVFSYLFPSNRYKSMYEGYLMMVIHYSLIKMLLIGISGYHQNLDDEMVVKLFQSFGRSFEHNNATLENVLNLLKELGCTEMSHIMILIKN